MKRIIGLLFIALSLSCCSKSETDKEGGGNYVLSITPQNLKFPANGDSQNVIVASNGQWSLSGGDSWCTPTITSGGNGANVTFSVQKNIELQPRNTSFTFTLGDEKEIPLCYTRSRVKFQYFIESEIGNCFKQFKYAKRHRDL